jgi:hypothetical protein
MWSKTGTLVFTIFCLLISCKNSTDSTNSAFECHSQDNQINILFKYGVAIKNVLNTFDCKYQKDLVPDPPVEVNFLLEKYEIDSIYIKMKEINFFSYPDTFSLYSDSDTISQITPSIKYYFYVECDSIEKELYWDDSILIENTDAEMLRSLNEYIIKIIQSKDAYKKLPEPKGGYI